MKKLYLLAILLVVVAAGCRKKDDPAESGTVFVKFQNMAGTQPFSLDKWFVTSNSDSIKVSAYKYYVSNIVLTTVDGEEYREPESYHLIDQSNSASWNFDIKNIPFAEYSKITFLIGVDPDRNTSGAQTGALDPLNGMYWDWITGYIMAKIEGVSPQSPLPQNNIFYHVGGFNGKDHVLRMVTLNFPGTASVTPETKHGIHIKADILEWFQTPNTIKIAELPGAMTPGADLKMIADNYADMFAVDHID